MKELAASGQKEGDRLVLNMRVPSAKMNQKIEQYVKEFIKRLKESINAEASLTPMMKHWIINQEIDKLAGSKLTEVEDERD